ncbi:MAG: S8 family serine peptidase, partial [Chitinivibrionia bacterium]|nr:S8 family serine peptidase [Chitinivibrionia bacterium]
MNIPKLFSGLIAACLLMSLVVPPSAAQESTNEIALRQLSEQFSRYLDEHRPQLYYDMLRSADPAQAALNRNQDIQLMYIDDNGMPVYYGVNNLVAAQTISTSRVWPGGGAGYSLTGSGTAASKFAIWDAGGVLLTHQELTGRVSNGDGHSGSHYHSTFVGGTLIASGVQANAKGMSYQANLNSYDWNSDASEMTTAASNGLLVSNHSYGSIAGWYYDGANWYWYGTTSISTTEDYGFGYYNATARQWDQIAYNAPNYLIVKSSGNDRSDDGPGPGGGHYYWNGGWVWGTATRDPDGGEDGYDCISYYGVSKNILTVGAVNDIPAGYTQPSDVVQTSFSSWGPADDGRIKPDIVGNGAGLYSCSNTNNTAYMTGSGTSASSPNVAGSINLLIRHYEAVKSATPRSATMKAIVIHTADEAGENDGPDYQNGWGLMNTETAADLIADTPSQIIQDNLANGSTDQHNFTLSSSAELRATIVWTDPAGTVPPASLNPTAPMLVRDLDLRLQHVASGTIYYPWRLDGANPADAATKGDNAIDNVEVVDVHCAPAGEYIATVSHKGVLSASQNYSLCWSTKPGLDPCAVDPTSIDFGSIEMLAYLDRTFTITSAGCDTLRGIVSESSAHFSIVSGGGSYELDPGEELVVTVRYEPQTLGVHSVTVETGDAACSDVFCTGFAYEPPP